MRCFTGYSKYSPSFPSLYQREATSQRTKTGFSLLSRKAKHWNSELDASLEISEMLEYIHAFKRHLDSNCFATRTISSFCVHMDLSTAQSWPIIGPCICMVCCDRKVLIVSMTSALIVPLTFLRANMQTICCSSLSEGMVSRAASTEERKSKTSPWGKGGT